MTILIDTKQAIKVTADRQFILMFSFYKMKRTFINQFKIRIIIIENKIIIGGFTVAFHI